jgi:hypothetical protein
MEILLLLLLAFTHQIRKLSKQDVSVGRKIILFFSPVKIVVFIILAYTIPLAAKDNALGFAFALYVIPAVLLLITCDHFTYRIKNRKNYYLVQFFIILLLLVAAGSVF